MAENELLTPAEVAEMFRVNPKSVTRWARAGKISAVRTLGGHRRFRADEIRRFLEEVQDLQVWSAASDSVGNLRTLLHETVRCRGGSTGVNAFDGGDQGIERFPQAGPFLEGANIFVKPLFEFCIASNCARLAGLGSGAPLEIVVNLEEPAAVGLVGSSSVATNCEGQKKAGSDPAHASTRHVKNVSPAGLAAFDVVRR